MVPCTGVVVQGVGVVADGGFTERIRALWEEFMGELRSSEGKEDRSVTIIIIIVTISTITIISIVTTITIIVLSTATHCDNWKLLYPSLSNNY